MDWLVEDWFFAQRLLQRLLSYEPGIEVKVWLDGPYCVLTVPPNAIQLIEVCYEELMDRISYEVN